MLNLSQYLKLKNIAKIKKIKKDVYKPIKISGAFSGNYVEYKSDSKKYKSISMKKYLNKIREHFRRMINGKRKNGEWKIQLIIKINFISSKNFNDVRNMYIKSYNVEIVMGFDLMKSLKNFLILFYKDIKKA